MADGADVRNVGVLLTILMIIILLGNPAAAKPVDGTGDDSSATAPQKYDKPDLTPFPVDEKMGIFSLFGWRPLTLNTLPLGDMGLLTLQGQATVGRMALSFTRELAYTLETMVARAEDDLQKVNAVIVGELEKKA